MTMPYIITSGDLNNPENLLVVNIVSYKHQAEEEAKKFLEQVPDGIINIFEWSAGFTAALSVVIDRQWSADYKLPQPTPEFEAIPEVVSTLQNEG